MTEYADPDLETVAPLPPLPPLAPEPSAAPEPGRGPLVGLVAAIAVVALIVGFGTATLVLDARDTKSNSLSTQPETTTPTSPATTPGASTPAPTTPGPTDPDASVLGGLIVRQSDVPPKDPVELLNNGADLSVATLDLCNGTFASESDRTARRQVSLSEPPPDSELDLSTEAILYRAPSDGVEAFSELRSVVAHCPPTPVVSPVGEQTVITTFGPAPDEAWPHTPTVSRLAYDFTTNDGTDPPAESIAVYLRRGRVLMGLYFAQPAGPQIAVDGQTTIQKIEAVFEARIAKLPASVVAG